MAELSRGTLPQPTEPLAVKFLHMGEMGEHLCFT